MLSTKKQIAYLQHLTDRAENIKQRHPSLIPQGLMHQVWGIDMTRIDYYNAILRQCDLVSIGGYVCISPLHTQRRGLLFETRNTNEYGIKT